MKKFLVTGLSALLIGTAATAAFVDQNAKVSTVAEALEMRDDSLVVLEGNIQKHLYKDKYLFADHTGEITVEIDAEDWMGHDVTPQDKVQISGEIDKDWFSTEVDVDRVKIIK